MIVLASLLAACGTTARLGNASGTAGGEAGLGSGPSSGSASGAAGALSSGSALATGTGGAGGGAGSTGGGAGAQSGGGSSTGGPGGGSASSGSSTGSGGTVTGTIPSSAGGSSGGAPGVTATTITVGIPYEVEGGAANSAIGANGITQGDEQGEAQAYIKYMNSHGGVDGRQLNAVFEPVDALSDATTASMDQALCQAFEQDHHVFAILDGGSPILEQCAQQAGGVSFWEDLSLSSARTFAQFPSYFEIGMMDLNRIVLNEAQALAAQGWFSPWSAALSAPGQTRAKLGVVTYNTPDFTYAINDVLNPALSRLGYLPASSDEIYVDQPQRTSDIATQSSEVASAVLRLRADGVDHVLIIDVTGTLTLAFLNSAEGQHYYPRYGWSSQNGPEALVAPGDVPKDQLNGSMGIGWDPALDIAAAQDPDNGPYANTARRQCVSILNAAGYTFADPNAEAVGLSICDELNFLKAAITAGGPTIDQADFIAGANRLGSWTGAQTFGNFFSAAQHDGESFYRDYQWNGGCGCMQYTSGNQTAIGEGEQ